jgi:type IX secretion system PorP/SprF family membrane protein
LKKILIILAFICLLPVGLLAQFSPDFSQYMFNGLALNPAYTGSREALSLSLLYRKQWVGFEGSPETKTFSAHAPLKNDRVALGLMVFNENFAATSYTSAFANYAYRIRLGAGKLSFGLKAGIQSVKESYNKVRTIDPNDPAFETMSGSGIVPNFGIGAYYYTNNYYAGISIPSLLSITRSGDSYSVYNDFANYSYDFTAGILLAATPNFKLKPSVLVKYQSGTVLYDFNTNFIFLDDRLWVGASYRVNQAVIGMLEFQINNQLRLGYSYDYTLGEISRYNNGSHEIMLRYEFSYTVKSFNPRYF